MLRRKLSQIDFELFYSTSSAESLASQAAKLQAEHDIVQAELIFKFDNAQAAIATQNEENEELLNLVQEHINDNFALKQTIKGHENFRIDDDVPTGPNVNESKPMPATSSTSPEFFPKVSGQSGMRIQFLKRTILDLCRAV